MLRYGMIICIDFNQKLRYHIYWIFTILIFIPIPVWMLKVLLVSFLLLLTYSNGLYQAV